MAGSGDAFDQDAMDRLFTATLETAVALLEKNGEFFPVLFELRPGGQVQAIAVLDENDRPSSQDVIDSYMAILRPRAASGSICAAAIGIDTRIRSDDSDKGRDAICVRIRAPGYARDVVAPYSMEKSGLFGRTRQVQIGEITASAATNELFD